MTERQFHKVWLPLQDRFWRIAFYLLEDREDAKDAVQELYLKLWKLRGQLDLIRDAEAYGALLMRNLCIDRIRRRRPSEALREDMGAPCVPPDDVLAQRESLQAVAAAMDRLGESQRTLLSLRVFQGLSYEEIGRKTGRSGLNVRVQVSMARKKLKQLL